MSSIRNITLRECHFTDSVVQSGSLLRVAVTLSLISYVYVEEALIRLTPTAKFSFTPADTEGRPNDFYLNHLSITHTSFEHVAAASKSSSNKGNLVYISISGQQNMNVLSLTFASCLASAEFIYIRPISPLLSYTATRPATPQV